MTRLILIFVAVSCFAGCCTDGLGDNRDSGPDYTTVDCVSFDLSPEEGTSADLLKFDIDDSADVGRGDLLQDIVGIDNSCWCEVDDGAKADHDATDTGIQDIGTTPCPNPFRPSLDYLDLCRRAECCFYTVFDPAPVELRPHSVEWTTAPVSPLPECVIPDPEVVIVRAFWTDVYGDQPFFACSEAPCGGYCLPSTGKVFLLNVRTLSVKYLGDEDWANWGPFTGLEPVLGGYRFQLSSEQSAIFQVSGSTVDVVDGIPQPIPWAACFLEIPFQLCLHFPLQAEPGDCPLHLAPYLDRWGACQTWE